jgi:YgiT-type zinc finger domain-containing protein
MLERHIFRADVKEVVTIRQDWIGFQNKENIMNQSMCPICGGSTEAGRTTFTVDYTEGVLVVRNVPATICSQCGEEWIADADADGLERFAAAARSGKKQFEVVDLTLVFAAWPIESFSDDPSDAGDADHEGHGSLPIEARRFFSWDNLDNHISTAKTAGQ